MSAEEFPVTVRYTSLEREAAMKKCLFVLTILALLFQPAVFFLPRASAQAGGAEPQSPNYPDETITITESFSGATAPGWNLLGDATLTNEGNGWLELTSNINSQTGAAFYNTAFPTNAVFDVEFEYAAYGGTGADGLTFFLIDGSATPTATGDGGVHLGYGSDLNNQIAGAFIAVGFNEYLTPYVGIYEPGNYSATPSYSVPAGNIEADRETPNHVHIIFYKNVISVWLEDVQVIADINWSSTPPATVKFGFSAATGGLNNFHLIRNATIRMIRPEGIIHVKPLPDGLSNWPCGQSWTDACSMQSAVDYAVDGNEVWVAAGTYYPSDAALRTATFHLKNDVAIYGGFDGTETEREQRDWVNNVTTLSGDIGTEGNNDDNSYHVVYGDGLDANTVLDGFTVTAGNANGSSYLYLFGGGMYNESSNPTLTNVIFSGNTAEDGGGGMLNDNSNPTLANVTFSGNTAEDGGGMYNGDSSPMLANVTFSDNTAEYGGGMLNESSSPMLAYVTFSGNTADYGGGMYNYSNSNPTLTNVTFTQNTISCSGDFCTAKGGGMFNDSSSPTLDNVTFTHNTASCDFADIDICFASGGGMYNDNSNPTLTDVTFSGNTASLGGGMYNGNNSNPTLANVTISGNTANVMGGGMFNDISSPMLANVTFSGNTANDNGGGMYNYFDSNPTLANAILWGNTMDQIYNEDNSTPVVTYSDVQGGYSGPGNIDADPQFIRDPSPGGDGIWGTPDDDYGDLRLQLTSPAIDAGDNAAVPSGIVTDLLGYPRFIEIASVPNTGSGTPPIVDMGAYEAQIVVYLVYLPLMQR